MQKKLLVQVYYMINILFQLSRRKRDNTLSISMCSVPLLCQTSLSYYNINSLTSQIESQHDSEKVYCCLLFNAARRPVIAWKPDLMLATEQLELQVSHCRKYNLSFFCKIVSGDLHVWHVTYSSVKQKEIYYKYIYIYSHINIKEYR